MTCYTWTLPQAGTSSAPSVQADTSLAAAQRRLLGVDIWLDVSDGQNVDRIVTAARDWRLVEGEEAVRQSLLRRLMTSPGGWKTKPSYGVGARGFLKRPSTAATVDELAQRIVSQFMVDQRVEAVSAVTADWSDNLLRISVLVKLRGRVVNNKPLLVQAMVN